MLRSGHLAHGGGADAPLALDLSSRRVRLALTLLDGVRTGQPLGALLGYRLERGLHEQHPELVLDRYIAALRALAPLDAITVAEHDLTVALERQVAVAQVLAGLRQQSDAAKAADTQLVEPDHGGAAGVRCRAGQRGEPDRAARGRARRPAVPADAPSRRLPVDPRMARQGRGRGGVDRRPRAAGRRRCADRRRARREPERAARPAAVDRDAGHRSGPAGHRSAGAGRAGRTPRSRPPPRC